PTKNEVAGYLQAYRDHFDLPVRWNSPVVKLSARTGGGEIDGYELHTPTGMVHARQVVVATGPFQRPYQPALTAGLGDAVFQVHSSAYLNPEQLPEGPALVVGGGNSGIQIADELSVTRPTTLAVGKSHPYIPKRFAGRSVFWWLDLVGFLRMRTRSRFGRYASRKVGQHGEPVIGDTPRRLQGRGRVSLAGRIVASEQGVIWSQEGAEFRPSAVVWATGYRPDFSWVDLPVVGPDGWIRQRDGRTDLPGLYTLGLPWQRTSASAFLGGVGADARDLAVDIAAHSSAGRP
ncbi:MAG: flavin-containing monooxygenase, partial [Micromonosporaceae bacterium]